jgi:DNA-binding transcriptional regulator GbsR (MarR family)
MSTSTSELTDFQRETIHLFVNASRVLSIPRSVGEIYGLLYATEKPLHLDQVVELLGISKGSASQGLRWLRAIGAIHTAYVNGDRRDHFVAETELRRLVFGFIRENVDPHINRGPDYLERITVAAESLDGEEAKFAAGRITKLKRWHKFASTILPMFVRLAQKL